MARCLSKRPGVRDSWWTTGAAVDDPEVARPPLRQPVAEVDVLHAVGEDRVEAAQRDGVGAPQGQRGAGERVEPEPLDAVGVLDREAAEEGVRQPAAGRERDAGGLDRAARVEQQRLRAEHVVVAERVAERRQPARRDGGVVVEEDHDVAGRVREREVVAEREAVVLGAAVRPGPGRRPAGPSAAAISGDRAVVPDDDLDVAAGRQHRLDAGGGELGVVVGRHDDRGQPGDGGARLEGGPVDQVPVEHGVAVVAGRRPERAAAVGEPAADADARAPA